MAAALVVVLVVVVAVWAVDRRPGTLRVVWRPTDRHDIVLSRAGRYILRAAIVATAAVVIVVLILTRHRWAQ